MPARAPDLKNDLSLELDEVAHIPVWVPPHEVRRRDAEVAVVAPERCARAVARTERAIDLAAVVHVLPEPIPADEYLAVVERADCPEQACPSRLLSESIDALVLRRYDLHLEPERLAARAFAVVQVSPCADVAAGDVAKRRPVVPAGVPAGEAAERETRRTTVVNGSAQRERSLIGAACD